MKTGLTLEQLAAEITRQQSAKEDYVVNTGNLRLESYGPELTLRVLDSDGADRIEPLEIGDIAHRQIGTHLSIPAKYYERMRSEDPGLLAHNVNILNIHALEYTGYVAHICDMKSYFDENLKLIDDRNLEALFPKGSPIYTKIRDDNPTRYVTGSKVVDSILADGCVIEGTVENCVLFRGVKVKKGAVVKNCVLMQDTVVEPNVELDCVVTDKNVKITAGKKLSGTESFPVYVQKNHTV